MCSHLRLTSRPSNNSTLYKTIISNGRVRLSRAGPCIGAGPAYCEDEATIEGTYPSSITEKTVVFKRRQNLFQKTFRKINTPSKLSYFAVAFSPFYVPGHFTLEMQLNPLHPRHFIAMKDEPGPAKQLLWHFTHHRTSKLLNSTWSKNRKLIKWIFYNAMGEHRLTPGGESTQNMKPLSRERLDSKDTSPPGKLWFVKDKRPGDWSQHVKLLESYGGQGRKQSDESNVKGTVRVVVKQEIHLTKASELMAEARLIVIEVLRMAEIQRKSPQSLPDLSKVHGYNGRDSYGRQTPQAHQGSDDGS